MTFGKIKSFDIPAVDRVSYNNAYKYATHIEEHIRNGRGLIMTGPVGTGKTSLAIAILRVAIDKGYNGLFVQMVSLLDTMFTLKDVSAEHRLRFERQLKRTPLLVLDDFGAEYGNKWVEQKVNAIISERVADGKSTIITTNLSPEKLKANYDERIYDRLKATSFVLAFRAESARKGLDIANI